ncbi:MAG: DoxX family protein [Moraxellaceae bacterium]
MNTLNPIWTLRAQAALRIVTGYLFFLHGSAKLFALPHVAMFDGLQLFSLMGVAGLLELVGGFLVMIGWWTRPVAFVLSGMMAVAYFMAHASLATLHLPLLNGGEAAALFSFIFLFLAAAGAGCWSVDTRKQS